MNTISLNRTVNVAFKQVQLLPALTPEMVVGRGGARAFYPTRPTGPTPAHEAARRLPRPLADQSAGESALFAILAVSAACALGLAFASVINLSASLPQFTAWLAQLLG